MTAALASIPFVQDPVRLLHRSSVQGYTDSVGAALRSPDMEMDEVPPEPEAISAEEQQVLSTRARASFAQERQEESRRQGTRAWADRLRKAENRAHEKGVDCYRHTAAIQREILAMEKLVETA